MTADLFPSHWNRTRERDTRDWLAAYREIEREAEIARELVNAACARYSADRCPATVDAYRCADRAYDAARHRFQRASFEIVGGVRAIAGIARVIELAEAGRGRML